MNRSIFRWPVRIYFEDTDTGGMVYHAHYISFYERARTEMLRQHHFNQQQLLNEHVAFAVRSILIEYLQPARLDDLLEVTTQLISLRKASLTFAQRIYHQDGRLLNTADVLIACINPQKVKPIALPKSIVAEFKQWLT